ncbi:MAG: cytochrome c [Verrucomicrobia bacterium]|nr:cytochrome c [Verrucomicrobiota bacterium]
MEPPRNPFAGDEWTLPAAQPSVTPGSGAGLVIANCAQCHSLDYITTQPPLTRAQWTAGVEKMRVRFGATTPTNLVPTLVDYLTSAYGKP